MLLVVTLAACWGWAMSAGAQDPLLSSCVVIVHPDNPADGIALAELDAIFLGKIEIWPDGTKTILAESADKGVREIFSQSVHARSEASVAAYWAARVFKGDLVRPARLDDERVVAFVRENAGAIGYVAADTSLSGVKPITVRR